MKNLFLLLFILCTIKTVYAQEEKKFAFGITVNHGTAMAFQRSLEGAASNDISRRLGMDLSMNYLYSSEVNFKTGLSLLRAEVKTSPAFDPNGNNSPYYTDLNVLSIPVLIQRRYSTGFFLESGIVMAIDLTTNSGTTRQNGLGASLGMGYDINIGSTVAITINPYLRIPAFLVFSEDLYPIRILESGIRLGFRIN